MRNRVSLGARHLDGGTETCRFDVLVFDELVGSIANRRKMAFFCGVVENSLPTVPRRAALCVT